MRVDTYQSILATLLYLNILTIRQKYKSEKNVLKIILT